MNKRAQADSLPSRRCGASTHRPAPSLCLLLAPEQAATEPRGADAGVLSARARLTATRALFFAQPAYKLRRRAKERAEFVAAVSHGETVRPTVSAEKSAPLGGSPCNRGGRS
jgi:hypothetical protein